ncbi:MAG: phytanoyl-CoA dioxygenase family protein [Deltaproteobacteria bacterium]|nr:phytanoyl-CoA dioxygenase family protein [Deltaproteobacteria bacterium]
MWRRMSPWMTVEGDAEALEPFPLPGSLRHRMVHDGYAQLADVVPAAFTANLASTVVNLRQRGIPPIFVFVYDQFWQLARRFERLLDDIVGAGHVMLPNVWTWYVDPAASESGWAPHRDRKPDTLLPDGMPKAVSVWVPLTDADPTNGCMYVVPAYLDADYQQREFTKLRCALHDARALPATAGSFLCWTQALAHWGGRSSDLARHPRISIGLEFQRGDSEPYDFPRVRRVPPSFEERLALIAKMIYLYWTRANMPRPYMEVAIRLGQQLARFA